MDLNMKEIWIESHGNRIQTDIYMPQSKTDSPAICIVPGGSGKNPPTEYKGKIIKLKAYNALANELGKSGFLVILFDPRGHGRSEGLRSYNNIIEDISVTIDFLTKHKRVDENRIGLLGICLGGCLGMFHAVNDSRIKSIATWGTRTRYDDLCDTNKKRKDMEIKFKAKNVRYEEGDWTNVKNTEDVINKIKQPIILAGGTNDIEHFRPETQISLIKKAINSKMAVLTIIKDAEHIVYEDSPQFIIYKDIIINWFKNTL